MIDMFGISMYKYQCGSVGVVGMANGVMPGEEDVGLRGFAFAKLRAGAGDHTLQRNYRDGWSERLEDKKIWSEFRNAS